MNQPRSCFGRVGAFLFLAGDVKSLFAEIEELMTTSTDTVRTGSTPTTTATLLAFTVAVGITIGLFMIPAFIIRPFTFQSARGLIVAMAVRQVAPLWTLVTLAASLLLATLLWRRVLRWKKFALAAGLCLASAAAVMSRIDYF
jgi:hypothetical protein